MNWIRVEKWGLRLLRRGFGDANGKEWRKEAEEVCSWRMGWRGRIMRGALKNRLEGEE